MLVAWHAKSTIYPVHSHNRNGRPKTLGYFQVGAMGTLLSPCLQAGWCLTGALPPTPVLHCTVLSAHHVSMSKDSLEGSLLQGTADGLTYHTLITPVRQPKRVPGQQPDSSSSNNHHLFCCRQGYTGKQNSHRYCCGGPETILTNDDTMAALIVTQSKTTGGISMLRGQVQVQASAWLHTCKVLAQ